jgi:hypothetical protein
LPIEKFVPEYSVFGQNSFWVHFYQGQMSFFESSIRYEKADTPFDRFKGKSFHLIEGSMCNFRKMKKNEKPLDVSENDFF